jgi:outer membrane protein assembly factor BamB
MDSLRVARRRRRFELRPNRLSRRSALSRFALLGNAIAALCAAASMGGGSAARAEHWAHWRGPTGNGAAAADAQPATEFSGTKNVAWKVELLGRGSGSPVVWRDRVFAVSAVPSADGTPKKLAFKTFCFARKDGRLLWEATAVEAVPHEGTHSTNGYASASPCTDGERVYSHFGSRGLYCYTLEGKLVWKRDDFGPMRTRNSFGEGSSPTLADSLILVPWDHEGPSFLYALDKLTGKTVWKTAREEPTCWATPLVVNAGGTRQVVMNGQNFARSYDLESGAELWKCDGQTERPAASAVADGGLIFVMSGFRGSFLGAFRPDGRGDLRGTGNVAWTLDRDTPDIASPLISQGRLYFYKGKSGVLTCLDVRTGKPFYQAQRIPGVNSTYASPVAAGGHVYLTDRNGTITVIKDAPTLEVVATNAVGEPIDATPAPEGRDLFLRSERSLICVRH